MFRNLKIILKLSLKSVFSNWARNKIIIFIISLSFILLEFLSSISQGFGLQVKNFVLDSLIGHMKIMHKEYKVENNIKYNFNLSQEQIDEILALSEVKQGTKRTLVPVVVRSERKIRNAMLVGIDENTEKDIAFIGKSYPYDEFANVIKNRNILVGNELLEKLQTQKEFKIVTSSQDINDKLREQAFFIKDTFSSSIPEAENIFMFTNINTVSDDYGLNGNFTEFSIILNHEDAANDTALKIKNIIASNPNLEVYTWAELMPFLSQWLDMMAVFMLIFFVIALLAASIPISNTLLISVLERTHEFGLMQALGMRKIYLFFYIVIEAVIIVSIGIIIGMVLGLLVSYFFQSTGIDISHFSEGASKLGLGDVIYPRIELKNTVLIAFVMFLSGVLASIYPALRASLLNPVQALSKRS